LAIIIKLLSLSYFALDLIEGLGIAIYFSDKIPTVIALA